MRLRTRLYLAITAILLVFSLLTIPRASGYTEPDAALKISVEEEEIALCYAAFAKADNAGANVTTLQATLDMAGEYLSKAELLYKTGDYDMAISYANQTHSELDGFTAEANALSEKAIHESYIDLVTTFGGSLVGTVAVIGGSLGIWFFLKKRDRGAVAK